MLPLPVDQLIKFIETVSPKDWFLTLGIPTAASESLNLLKETFSTKKKQSAFITHIRKVAQDMQTENPEAFGGEAKYYLTQKNIAAKLLYLIIRSPEYDEKKIKREIEKFIDTRTISPNGNKFIYEFIIRLKKNLASDPEFVNQIRDKEHYDATRVIEKQQKRHMQMTSEIRYMLATNKSDNSDEFLEQINKLNKLIANKQHERDDLIRKSPEKTLLYIQKIFERSIIHNQGLDDTDRDAIRQIRADRINNPSLYTWYHRNLIVSGLTVGLLRHFDIQKVHLLLDFLSDFEDNVWEKACVGLFLVFMRFDQTLQGYPDVTRRLYELKASPSIQAAILATISLLHSNHILDEDKLMAIINPSETDFYMKKYVDFLKLHHQDVWETAMLEKDTLLNFNLFQYYIDPKESPYMRSEYMYMWFLPFYKDNSDFKKVLGEISVDIRKDKLEENLINTPIISPFEKYMISDVLPDMPPEMLHFFYDVFDHTAKMRTEFVQQDQANFNMGILVFHIIRELHEFNRYFPEGTLLELFSEKEKLFSIAFTNILLEETKQIEWKMKNELQSKNLKEALHYARELAHLEPDNSKYQETAASLCMDIKDYKDAISYYENAIKLEPGNAGYLHSLAICYHNQNQHDIAIDFYAKALFIQPDKLIWQYNKGICQKETKRYKEAIETFRRVLMKDRQVSVETVLRLAECYEENKDFLHAIRFYKKANALQPDDKVVRHKLFIYYYSLKNFSKAKDFASDYYKVEHDLNPYNSDFIEKIMQTYIHTGYMYADPVLSQQMDTVLVFKKKIIETAFNLDAPLKKTIYEWIQLAISAIVKANNNTIIEALCKIIPFDEDSKKKLLKYLEPLDSANEKSNLLIHIADDVYKEREEKFGSRIIREVEKFVMLTTVDDFWMKHLEAIGMLRQNIGMYHKRVRKELLMQYEKEANEMLKQFWAITLPEEVVYRIYKVQIKQQ